jgi:uncharacterized protein (UPF0303 family)
MHVIYIYIYKWIRPKVNVVEKLHMTKYISGLKVAWIWENNPLAHVILLDGW